MPLGIENLKIRRCEHAGASCCLYAFLASLFGFVELLTDVFCWISETAAFKTEVNRSKTGHAVQVQAGLILLSL